MEILLHLYLIMVYVLLMRKPNSVSQQQNVCLAGDVSVFERAAGDKKSGAQRERAGGNYGAGTQELQMKNYASKKEVRFVHESCLDLHDFVFSLPCTIAVFRLARFTISYGWANALLIAKPILGTVPPCAQLTACKIFCLQLSAKRSRMTCCTNERCSNLHVVEMSMYGDRFYGWREIQILLLCFQ